MVEIHSVNDRIKLGEHNIFLSHQMCLSDDLILFLSGKLNKEMKGNERS